MDPGDFSRADLERLGFVGFLSVKELLASRPVAASLPCDAAGVYVAYRDSDRPVSFVRSSPTGQWKGDLSLPLADLRGRWVAESHVIYIGKAARPEGSSNSIRERVSAYIRFGAGSNARHAGGYPTWQLRNADRLLIAWCVVKRPRLPKPVEDDLIDAHVRRFGARPFANSIGGQGGEVE